jgi:hypothetical protein
LFWLGFGSSPLLLAATRCKQAETSRTNSTFGFLPTQKPTLKKPKELFFANAKKKVKFEQKRKPI